MINLHGPRTGATSRPDRLAPLYVLVARLVMTFVVLLAATRTGLLVGSDNESYQAQSPAAANTTACVAQLALSGPVRTADADETTPPAITRIDVPESGRTLRIERVYVAETNQCLLIVETWRGGHHGISVHFNLCHGAFKERANTGKIAD